MTSQTSEQTIAIHISPNISRSKGNRTMTLGQFIESIPWEMFFLMKLVPESFIKTQNRANLCLNSLKCYTVCFYFTLFDEKKSLTLYSINWPSFIIWLPFRLEILGNMCILNVDLPGFDVINFEINLSYHAVSLHE